MRNGKHVHGVHVQWFHDSNERTDKHSQVDPCLGYIAKSIAEEAKPKPCGDFFAEKRVVEPF